MMNPSEEYLKKKIKWDRSNDSEYPYCIVIDGKTLILRLNDFPEEPLYTLIVDGEEIIDLQSIPSTWQIPRSRRKSNHETT